MTSEELKRFDELEQRLRRLEARLDLPHPVQPPPAIMLPSAAQALGASVSPPVPRAPASPTRAPLPAHAPAAIPTYAPPKAAAAFTPKAGGEPSIERALGLQWAGWAGAVALVISMGLGVKFAYEQGWFENVPPGGRAILMALCGFTLIGLGEWVYRKVNTLAASGLFGAGVGMLFVAAYAGHAYYKLYPPATAFWLAGLAVLIGAGLSMRGKLAAVAVLSILGGMLAPVIIDTGAKPGVGLLVFALALQSLALFLSWWGASEKWWALRMLGLLSSTIWYSVVMFDGGTDNHVALELTLFSSALFQSELAASALRAANAAQSSALLKQASNSAAAIFSVIVTALLCVAGLYLLRDESRLMRVTWVLALAVFFGWQSISLPSLIGQCASGLAKSFRIQAALLALVAVPVALDRQSLAIGWALMGVAFAWLAYARKFYGALFFAGLALVLGAGTWFVAELWDWDRAAPQHALLGNAFSAAGAVLMAAFYLSGCFVRKIERDNPAANYNFLRMTFWSAVPLIFFWDVNVEIHHYFHPVGSTWFDFPAVEQVTYSVFWGLLAIALVLLGFMFKARLARYGGLALFALTLFKIVTVDGNNLSSGYRVLSFLGVGALLLATSVVYGRLSKEF